VVVVAVPPQPDVASEGLARAKAAQTLGSDYFTWEAHEIAAGKWACFVCAHEDVFALND
jgi:hypothetical protein